MPGRPGRGPAPRGRATCSATTRGWPPIEYSIEHDDGQSLRAMDKAEIVLHRAVALRQDADHDVPRPAARAVRRQLPAGRGGPRVHRPAAADRAPPGPHLRAGHDPGPALARSVSSVGPNSQYASLEQCTYELRRAEAMYRGQPAPGHQLDHEVGRGDVHPHRPDPAVGQRPASARVPRPARRSELVSANVKWFSSLGMADLEEVGGKNSSLGEMIGNLAVGGRAGAGRVRDDGRRRSATSCRRRGWRRGSPG